MRGETSCPSSRHHLPDYHILIPATTQHSQLFINPTDLILSLQCCAIMYSGSNSFLGANSGRPGAQQYGSSFNMQPGQQPPQQQQPFAPQPTGFGQPPIQQQYTGYPIQPQQTGFQQQQMPQQQQPLQQQYTGFPGAQQPQQQYGQVPQQTAFQTGVPPMPPMPQQQSTPAPVQSQPTGFAAMAASFQSAPSPTKPRGRRGSKAGAKIPSIRLSFITAQDQAKFETLFKSAAGADQTLSGEKSRDLLMRSKLDGGSLSQIWYLSLHPGSERFANL